MLNLATTIETFLKARGYWLEVTITLSGRDKVETVSNPSFVCEECGGTRFVDRDGFRWCVGCGIGERILDVVHRVPGVGSDTHYAPENKLCFGNDLGTPALNNRRDSKALYKVLGKNNKENLGVRAIQLKNECMASQETTITQRMKSYLSHWCKQFDWADDVLLSNVLGANAKWVGTILTMMNDGSDSKEFARGIFFWGVLKMKGREKALEIAEALELKEVYVKKTRGLLRLDKLIQ